MGQQSAPPVLATRTPTSSSRLPLRRVLVVDGDADTREMYREFFSQKGWAVSEARDGREALVLAVAERPTIVVTELWLHFIDGVDLCRLLRRDAFTGAVPILVVTSEMRETYWKRAQEAGANAFLLKPTAPDAIATEMDRLTSHATAVAALTQLPEARRSLVKAHQRFETATPNEPAPDLCCPRCAEPLTYQKSFFGGVSRRHPERWDYFKCARCGEYSYRHRTRKLRHIA